jgi:hypothetical protein
MRMTAIQTQTEQKWQDRSAHRAEERYRRARKLRLRRPIPPFPAVCATADAARGEKRLFSAQIEVILTSDSRSLWGMSVKEGA